MVCSILTELNKSPFKGVHVSELLIPHSPSLLDHQRSVDTDKGHLSKIQAMKVEQVIKIEALGDQVPKNRQLGLARMMEQEEAFLNTVRIVGDRGPLFTSKFWSSLCYFLGIKRKACHGSS